MSRPTDAEFCTLFASRGPTLRRTAFLLSGDWHEAEDLVQIAFTKLYMSWRRLRRQDSVDAYLRRILVRSFVDERRRKRPHLMSDVPEQRQEQANTDDRVLVRRALGRVPPRQRACLVLRYFEDLTVNETARALRCSEGTVKSQTARGLDCLREELAKTGVLQAFVAELRGGSE